MKDNHKRKNDFSHIASAIIPSVGIIAVPSALSVFPRQKTNPDQDWDSLSLTLIRAASESQLLLHSSSLFSAEPSPERPQSRRVTSPNGEIDKEQDDEESSATESIQRSHRSRQDGLSDAERKLFGQRAQDHESSLVSKGVNSLVSKDPRVALTEEMQRLSDRTGKNSTVGGSRVVSPLILDPVLSGAGPTSARSALRNDNVGLDGRATVTPRSSLNASTTIPMSARSVAFKDPLVDEIYDASSSKTYPTSSTTILPQDSNLEKLVLPPPEEYQQNFNALERKNEFLNNEIEQLMTTNQNLQKQYEKLLDRIQSSSNLTRQDLNDLLQETGYNQNKNLENRYNTLRKRCDELEQELKITRERQSSNPSSAKIDELKRENNFLKDYVIRLNASISELQTENPPKSLEKENREAVRRMKSLPSRGPMPSWLLNRRYLAPLFLFYDEKILDQHNEITRFQEELAQIKSQVKDILDENSDLHRRLSSAGGTSSKGNDGLSDLNQIKRQAYLVLKENEILQKQVELETNQLAEIQRNQIDEVSNLNRRLLLIETEKAENDRILETFRIRNEDLRRKYEQILRENDHRISIAEHINEVNEMKHLTDELSEKHGREMFQLLRRIQENESEKKTAQLKLSECRAELESLKGEAKVLRKTNKKLQLRVQTFEKKVQLEQIRKENLNNQLDTKSDEFEQMKIERDTFLNLATQRDEEMKKMQNHVEQDQKKLNELEERLENFRNKNLHRSETEKRKLTENVELRLAEYEQRIQQLKSMLNEKETTIHDLNAEKRILQIDLETIWQASTSENLRKREDFLSSKNFSFS